VSHHNNKRIQSQGRTGSLEQRGGSLPKGKQETDSRVGGRSQYRIHEAGERFEGAEVNYEGEKKLSWFP